MFNKVFDKVVNVHTSDELERNLEGIAGYVKYEGFWVQNFFKKRIICKTLSTT